MPKKVRRPNALDRNLADIFRKLKIGRYRIDVMPYRFGYIEIKTEGSWSFALNDTRIIITPEKK